VSGATLPVTLSTNQTVTLTVQFDPATSGSASGTLTIISTSTTNPTDIITLSGNGVSIAYQVNLAWNAPTSSSDPVASYNVYRAPSGTTSYQQVNTAAVIQTSYVDGNVQLGSTYDYIVESVDAQGNTSTPSNMASVNIP
jgi:fibronectin type 3 domain-containing protein